MVPYTRRMTGLALGALAVLGACEVHGIIGDNRGMDGDGGVLDDGDDGGTIADGADADGGGIGSSTDHGDEGGDTTGGVLDDDDDDGTIFDLGQPDAPPVCGAPLPVICDEMSDDPWHAMGINCDGGVLAETSYTGDARSLYVQDGKLGTSGVYAPRQGNKMVILSTGDAQQIPLTPDECAPEFCPSTEFDPTQMPKLPEPLDVHRVANDRRNCMDDPTLVGLGDCSNTLQDQWIAGYGAVDYAELRMTTTVPEGADAFRYEFAFVTIEYPAFAIEQTPYNDMYLAWLQSERWTGNVSFDGNGNPISILAVFLEYQDDPPHTDDCPKCGAAELAGFAAQGHGGTDWLSTVAPVTPGEEIEVVFAIMDITDGYFDSAVMLDGFEWTCTDEAPITTPVG